jgi:hypothetical protein
METYKMMGRIAVFGLVAGLAGCVAPPLPPARPETPFLAPTSTDLLHIKADAYNAGVAAGERIQARRDRAALAAAAAQPACPTAMPAPAGHPATPSATVPEPIPLPVPVPAKPSPNPGTVYTPGGPAIPVVPAQ